MAFGSFTDLIQKVSDLDIAANGSFGPYRHTPLIEIFLWITTLGAGPAVLAVVVVASALLATGQRRVLVRPLWLLYLGMEATVWSTKYAVGRIRPEMALRVVVLPAPFAPSKVTTSPARTSRSMPCSARIRP